MKSDLHTFALQNEIEESGEGENDRERHNAEPNRDPLRWRRLRSPVV